MRNTITKLIMNS